MIIRQTFDMMVEGMDGCCGKHSRLSPATTQPFSQNPSSSDVVGRADQHRADRSTEPFGEGDGDSVEEVALAREIDPLRNVSIPSPVAIQVAPNAMYMIPLHPIVQVVEPLHRPAA